MHNSVGLSKDIEENIMLNEDEPVNIIFKTEAVKGSERNPALSEVLKSLSD